MIWNILLCHKVLKCLKTDGDMSKRDELARIGSLFSNLEQFEHQKKNDRNVDYNTLRKKIRELTMVVKKVEQSQESFF